MTFFRQNPASAEASLYVIQRSGSFLSFTDKAEFESSILENDVCFIYTAGETFTIAILQNLTFFCNTANFNFGATSTITNIKIVANGNIDLTAQVLDNCSINVSGYFISSLANFTNNILFCEYFHFPNNNATSNYNNSRFVCSGMIAKKAVLPIQNFANAINNSRFDGVFATCSNTSTSFTNCYLENCEMYFYNNSLGNVLNGLVRFTNLSNEVWVKNCFFRCFNNQTSAFFNSSNLTTLLQGIGILKPNPLAIYNVAANFRDFSVVAKAV